MYSQGEGFLQGHGGITLFFQTWEKPSSRGTVIISGGQAEHSECYNRVIDYFERDEWDFMAWDMRGHGRSEGKRGYAASFEDYVLDYQLFLKEALTPDLLRKGPVVLLAHSMGALIQLKTLIEKPDLPVAAQVCSAPFLGIALPVPKWKIAAAGVLNSIAPQTTMWNEIRNEQLTRDPDIIREFEQDVLRHDRISPGVFLGFDPAFEFVRARAGEIRVPTLFQLPEQDPVVSTPVGLEVFEKLGSTEKELKVYGDGARHEMYNDIHRGVVLADLKAYLDSVLAKKGGR